MTTITQIIMMDVMLFANLNVQMGRLKLLLERLVMTETLLILMDVIQLVK